MSMDSYWAKVMERRAIIVQELQYLAGVMRHVPFNWTGAPPFELHQPQVRNNLAFGGSDHGCFQGRRLLAKVWSR